VSNKPRTGWTKDYAHAGGAPSQTSKIISMGYAILASKIYKTRFHLVYWTGKLRRLQPCGPSWKPSWLKWAFHPVISFSMHISNLKTRRPRQPTLNWRSRFLRKELPSKRQSQRETQDMIQNRISKSPHQRVDRVLSYHQSHRCLSLKLKARTKATWWVLALRQWPVARAKVAHIQYLKIMKQIWQKSPR